MSTTLFVCELIVISSLIETSCVNTVPVPVTTFEVLLIAAVPVSVTVSGVTAR